MDIRWLKFFGGYPIFPLTAVLLPLVLGRPKS